MNRFVLDASVVLAWCFPDENASLAQHIADMFKRGATALAPSFWPHKVLNALLAGERRRHISKGLVQNFLDDLVRLPVTLDEITAGGMFSRIPSLSRDHGLTAYDAAYLDLALIRELPLASLDDDLIRACKRAGVGLVEF